MKRSTSTGTLPNEHIASLQLFQGKEHQPFCLQGGRPSAVLVHGFLGSPAELRPLAAELHQIGWTVYVPLLPGYGPEIDTLFTRTQSDWIAAVRSLVDRLKAEGRPVLLVGYSLGAAVSLNVAASTQVDGLVLLAPFWKIGDWRHRLIWAFLKRIFPRFQPFRRADFADPRMREFFESIMSELDPADPRVQENLRSLTVPSRFVDQIAGLCRGAKQSAAGLALPVGIVQGTADEAVKVEATRQLISLINSPVTYRELAADHSLIEAHNHGFQPMAQFIIDYAGSLLIQETI